MKNLYQDGSILSATVYFYGEPRSVYITESGAFRMLDPTDNFYSIKDELDTFRELAAKEYDVDDLQNAVAKYKAWLIEQGCPVEELEDE